ncbi:MAG: DUF3305 domain-containing protein [Pseudomonadota bacterium]
MGKAVPEREDIVGAERNPPIESVVTERHETIPLGIVLSRRPGVTRWAAWSWRPTAVLPGAGPAAASAADWQVLTEAPGGAADFHAATLPLTLHRAETEAYRVALSNDPPILYVVLRPNEADEGGAGAAARPYVPFLATASPFEAQDYADSGEELVEPVAMTPALIAWISSFVDRHHRDEAFKKRKRDRVRIEAVEDGRGDARIRQTADVYRSPASRRAGEAEKRTDGAEEASPGMGDGPDGETVH